MREVKFRGKRVDNGEWVYGYFVKDEWGKSLIVNGNYTVGEGLEQKYIHHHTVCQYTGLKDVNGVDIYEGDLIKTKHFNENNEEYYKIGQIKYHDKYKLGLCIMWNKGHMDIRNSLQISRCYGEIVGNIHDEEV